MEKCNLDCPRKAKTCDLVNCQIDQEIKESKKRRAAKKRAATMNKKELDKHISKYAEDEALDNYLSEYPLSANFDTVLNMVKSETEGITAYCEFEYIKPEGLVKMIVVHKHETEISLRSFLKRLKFYK